MNMQNLNFSYRVLVVPTIKMRVHQQSCWSLQFSHHELSPTSKHLNVRTPGWQVITRPNDIYCLTLMLITILERRKQANIHIWNQNTESRKKNMWLAYRHTYERNALYNPTVIVPSYEDSLLEYYPKASLIIQLSSVSLKHDESKHCR